MRWRSPAVLGSSVRTSPRCRPRPAIECWWSSTSSPANLGGLVGDVNLLQADVAGPEPAPALRVAERQVVCDLAAIVVLTAPLVGAAHERWGRELRVAVAAEAVD